MKTVSGITALRLRRWWFGQEATTGGSASPRHVAKVDRAKANADRYCCWRHPRKANARTTMDTYLEERGI